MSAPLIEARHLKKYFDTPSGQDVYKRQHIIFPQQNEAGGS